jgi:hypothetical protein
MVKQIIYILENRTVVSLKAINKHVFKNTEELLAWLKPGMMLKFGGCRDGRGYRRLEEIVETTLPYGSYGIAYRIIGRKISLRPRYGKDAQGLSKIKIIEFLLEPYMTENSLDKLQAYFDTTTQEFVKIKIQK